MTAPVPTRSLTRRQVAQLLGCDKRSVARRDGVELHPVRAEDGSMHYDEGEVRALLATRSPAAAPAVSSRALRTDGEIARDAFRQFDAGHNAADVVIDLAVTPATASALFTSWAELRSAMVITGDERKGLGERLPNVESVLDLLNAIDDLLADRLALSEFRFGCACCGEQRPITLEVWRTIRQRGAYLQLVCRSCSRA